MTALRKENIDPVKTGNKIHQLRMEKGWSRARLAKEMKISETPIYMWENGKQLPVEKNLIRLARILEIGIMDIVVLKEKPVKEKAVMEFSSDMEVIEKKHTPTEIKIVDDKLHLYRDGECKFIIAIQ